MVHYSFGVHLRHEPDRLSLSYVIGISNPEYVMLQFLYINNSLPVVDDILLHLSKVQKGEQEDFLWGQDWCVITSSKEVSSIEHYDHGDPDWMQKPLYSKIPTDWLILMMRDWRFFLELNSQEYYLNRDVPKSKRFKKK